MGYPHPTSFTATRHVCLGGDLARPCTISVHALSPPPKQNDLYSLGCCQLRQEEEKEEKEKKEEKEEKEERRRGAVVWRSSGRKGRAVVRRSSGGRGRAGIRLTGMGESMAKKTVPTLKKHSASYFSCKGLSLVWYKPETE